MRARRTLATLPPIFAGLAVGLSGCLTTFGSPARDAARPAADAVLADAPNLCPHVPVTSTNAARGQAPDVVQTAATAQTQVAAKIRASVNGIPILDEELREAMAPFLAEVMSVPEGQREMVFKRIAQRELERLIERELVLEEAYAKLKATNNSKALAQLNTEAAKEADRRIADIRKQLKLASDDDLKAAKQAQGLSISGIRRQVERNFVMMEYVRNVIYPLVGTISLAKVREYYETHPEDFRNEDKIRWQDIFIDASKFPDAAAARAFAEQVRGRAAAGEDFAALAKQFDDGDAKLRNGDGLGSKRGEVVPPQCDAVVWSLKPGQVGPLIDMGFGFHVVRVAERTFAGPKPFDVATQDAIRNKLRGVIADREYKRIVDDLRKNATIVVNQ